MPSNFLKDVILRLNFKDEIKFSPQVVDNIKRMVSDSFPEFEPREQVSIEMTIDNVQKTTKEKRAKAYYFHNNANSSITLEPNAIIIGIKNYNTYEEFRNLVQKVIQNLGTENSSAKTSRIGLRYINQIIINEGDPFEWTEFIKEPLTSSLDFIERRSELSRLMGVLELNRSDYFLRFQYGWFNSEYPNPIAKKEFSLDYDCYSKNETELSSILGQVDIYHTAIKELYEHSILDGLRNYGR